MLAPPELAGAENVTEACVSPAVAVPIVGAPGTTALTLKVRETVAAALTLALPAWSASIVQLPAVTKVRAPPAVIVQTPVVEDVKDTVRPESDVADSVGAVPKF